MTKITKEESSLFGLSLGHHGWVTQLPWLGSLAAGAWGSWSRRARWMFVFRSLPSYSDKDFNPGNGDIHSGWVFLTQFNLIKLATPQQAQRSISPVILCFGKVTPGTSHHS